MSALFRALVFGHVRGNALRSAVTILAVALGVAIGLAIDLANATAIASFSASVNIVANHVNLQVLGIANGFDDRTLLRVQNVPGVRSAAPVIEDSLTVGARPGDPFSGEVLQVLGLDLLRPVPGARGVMATPGSVDVADPWLLVNGHGAFISERVAHRYGWHAGSRIVALAGDRVVTVQVAGVLPAGTVGVDSSVVFVDIATAQEIFGKLGRLDRIDCIVDPAQLGAVTAAVRRVLPPGVRAIQPRARNAEIERMLRSFQLNLAALAYIALLVGMFLIYNTVAIAVVQRRPEIGTLRALGALRRQIFVTFLGEGVLFGVVGALLGLALGAFLAQFSVAAVSRTVDTLYVASHADRVVYDPLLFLKAFAAGVVAAMLSAVFPALDAAATAPATTMRAQGFERRFKGLAGRAALIGTALLLAGYACTLARPIDDVPVFGYLAGLLYIFGGASFAPLAIAGLSRLTLRLSGRRSATAELAAENLASAPIRNSVAVASLMVAIAMMVAVAVLISSFRTTVVAWADESLRADLFVQPLGGADASFDATFSPRLATEIAALPGVAAIDTFRAITIPYAGRLTTLAAVDVRGFADRHTLRFMGGADPRKLARELPGTTGVVVSEPFATKFGVVAGDRLTLGTPSGPVTFTVAALYNDYSSDAGMVLLDSGTYRRLYHDDSLNSLAIYAQPGADIGALRSAIVRRVRPLRIDVETTRELRAFVVAVFNRTFAITYALYVISIAIAVLGVVSTLFALVLERRREIGLLRYLGLRARDVRRMVYAEAAMIGLLGGIGGVLVGLLLALLLIFVINRQAFGWLIELHVPYDFLLEAIVLVVAAALAAGVYPAHVAARIRTAEAVRTE